ncbi:colanic acid capsullar biosynthesis activation protein A [Escherichia coli]|uniref:Colanic acid capsullar biosynthesis activation protein A n=1 Tax=Escherichia coli TaxID=562 RepID=A0A485JGH4_ECOLX|nr:colanic acid capsullar biosynthesis activation protein A [Escherichia coli]
MSTIIMDLCSYTRLGLTGYLLSRGVKKREINDIETVDDLAIACDSQRPSVVFINEDCSSTMLLTVSVSSSSLINIPIRYLSFLWQ